VNYFTETDSLQAEVTHQALDRAACRGKAFSPELPPDLACAIDSHGGLLDTLDLSHQDLVILGTSAAQFWHRWRAA
jgi:hypothetical protein